MSVRDPVTHPLTPEAGAVFYRCALQVNPHHYSDTYRGQPNEGDESSYAEAVIARAVTNGISVLAITDHNDVSSVPLFQSAAAGSGVVVFPGFEIRSSDGIHVLCIYPRDNQADQLGRYLGELGIRETGSSSTLSSGPFEDVLLKVREQGGITIAAHVTQKNGLFRVLTGQPRINAWRSKNLLAVQIPGPVEILPKPVLQIVENENREYERPTSAGSKLAVAVVNAKDVAEPEDLDDPSATCWIKMSEVSIEGLRQAFLDPDSRIRLNSDVEPERYSELLSIDWDGGFLDGASVRLNTNLNVLVGGRGTGKSTVIESLRYVLGLDAIGVEAAKTHQGIVKQVLRGGTKISLRVRCVRPAQRDYLIERTVPNPPVVRDPER